mmetsp:Transcript_24062/g.83519  ORF Transcript_24062/g.83519 Transcript_24062/m.83519 type:complete len:249 (-) Transcript_24062:328-1074(-)
MTAVPRRSTVLMACPTAIMRKTAAGQAGELAAAQCLRSRRQPTRALPPSMAVELVRARVVGLRLRLVAPWLAPWLLQLVLLQRLKVRIRLALLRRRTSGRARRALLPTTAVGPAKVARLDTRPFLQATARRMLKCLVLKARMLRGPLPLMLQERRAAICVALVAALGLAAVRARKPSTQNALVWKLFLVASLTLMCAGCAMSGCPARRLRRLLSMRAILRRKPSFTPAARALIRCTTRRASFRDLWRS